MIPLLLACSPTISDTSTPPGASPGACAWDEDDTPGSAGELREGGAEGYICPQADRDWYRLTVPSGDNLLDLSLSLDAELTGLELTYIIWDAAGEALVGSPDPDAAATQSADLTRRHWIAGGEYLVEVRDSSDDASDLYHPYQLSIETMPDPDGNEPNDSTAQATAAAGKLEGYLSYNDDEDWFAFTAPDRGLVTVRLAQGASEVAPRYRLLAGDGTELAAAGPLTQEPLDGLHAIETAGEYFVVIDSEDDSRIDHSEPYSLQIGVFEDPDDNEPNNEPEQAIELGSASCSSQWSDWIEVDGYLAALGDADWFALDLEGCDLGLIEAELTFSDAAALPAELLPSMRLVRPVGDDDCTENYECQELSSTCDSDYDCAMLGNECLTSGQCGGSGLCLPESACGAALLAEVAREDDPGQLRISAPIDGLDRIYLAYADYHADSSVLDQPYALRIRLRTDPDLNEPNNVYTAGEPTSTAAGTHSVHAVEIPVYDCTTTAEEAKKGIAPQCCSDSPWTEGTLAYAYDQDWFSYSHPCPGEDCMVRIHYNIDGGPIDTYMQVYQGNSLWFDDLLPVTDQAEDQARLLGSFGGLEASDECFYAFQNHSSDYRLMLRDTAYTGDDTAGTWDWSADQDYRICIEKIADTCEAPCALAKGTDQCSTP